jgi:sugar phosphate isomerase/epimerase
MLAELGVTGPDLTLRRGGLVLPERVEEDLPMAAAAFRDKGLAIPMVTTTVTSAADEMSRRVLRAIARQGIGYYKLGYFYYKDLAAWRQTIDQTRTELQALAKVNQTLSLKAGLHNHAGDSVGCAIWDAWEALEGVDPLRAGFYFDPAQATIEGGKTGWNLNFRRIQPRLLMVAIKDFVWEKTDKGWRTRWVPLGQGIVNWDAVFPLLNAATFPGPVSLHIEYDPGGKSPTERYDRALEAAARDLQFLRARLT